MPAARESRDLNIVGVEVLDKREVPKSKRSKLRQGLSSPSSNTSKQEQEVGQVRHLLWILSRWMNELRDRVIRIEKSFEDVLSSVFPLDVLQQNRSCHGIREKTSLCMPFGISVISPDKRKLCMNQPTGLSAVKSIHLWWNNSRRRRKQTRPTVFRRVGVRSAYHGSIRRENYKLSLAG